MSQAFVQGFIQFCLGGILATLLVIAVCLIISILLDIEELERFVEKRERYERKP
jgi:hypothetical protein